MSKRLLVLTIVALASALLFSACRSLEPRPMANRPTATPLPPTATPTPRPTRPPKPTAMPATGSSGGAVAWSNASCHLCHGDQAAGGIGPALAHTPLDATTFIDDVRNAAPPMPSFPATEVNDAALMTIYTWLQNPEVGGSAPVSTPNQSLSNGAQLWQSKDCSVCHGVFGQGGTGPQLAGTDLSREAFLRQVRQGSEQMPTHDVEAASDEELDRMYQWLAHDAPGEGGC